MNREHREISGTHFTLEKIIPFEVWIRKKYKSFDAFMDLKIDDRETIFLRWKWGAGDESNKDFEISERNNLQMIKNTDLSILKASLKFYFEKKIGFENYCKEVKTRIGLINKKIEEFGPEVRTVAEIFDGELA